MAKVLILGGAGFIGYHLASHLALQGGQQITIVDNLSRGRLDSDMQKLLNDNSGMELITGDITRPETFDQFKAPFDHVYLLAGIVGVRNVEASPARVIYTNATVALNTVDWLSRVGCGRLFFSSTSETYAGSVDIGLAGVPTSEAVPVSVIDVQHPRSSYAISKLLGEAAITHYAKEFGFPAVVVRYHNVYGPRMGFDHVIPELMERMHRGTDPFPIYGSEQTRAFCYITDAVKASVDLMTCPLDGCQLVHVGNDQEEITIGSLLEKVLEITGFRPEIQQQPAPSGAVSRRCPDVGKLRRLTQFQPKVDIDHGLSLTWEWYRHRLSSMQEVAGGDS